MILDKIIEYKKEFVAARKAQISLPALLAEMEQAQPPLDFKMALAEGRTNPAVVAEVKKASPSKGLIRPDFDYLSFAKSYEKNFASAISVLTDEKFFQGSDDFLRQIKREISIPVLRKDFIIDGYQIYEARSLGADAILLIVKCLEKSQIIDFLCQARSLEMNALVEAHTIQEAETALSCGAEIIGVNNRNLDTFEVSLETTREVSKIIPEETVFVSESGIKTREDVEFLTGCGADAVLVGETLMRYKDPGEGIPGLVKI